MAIRGTSTRLKKIPRVSVLIGLEENDPLQKSRIRAFRLGMRDLDWIEKRNVEIEYRFTGVDADLINRHVTEAVKLAPDVIVANSSPVTAAESSIVGDELAH